MQIETKGLTKTSSGRKYKIYRNKLYQVIRVTERQYYQDQFTKHKTSLKKSWQIIKTVIDTCKFRPSTSEFKSNGNSITNGKHISDTFNKFLWMSAQTWQKIFPGLMQIPWDKSVMELMNAFI